MHFCGFKSHLNNMRWQLVGNRIFYDFQEAAGSQSLVRESQCWLAGLMSGEQGVWQLMRGLPLGLVRFSPQRDTVNWSIHSLSGLIGQRLARARALVTASATVTVTNNEGHSQRQFLEEQNAKNSTWIYFWYMLSEWWCFLVLSVPSVLCPTQDVRESTLLLSTVATNTWLEITVASHWANLPGDRWLGMHVFVSSIWQGMLKRQQERFYNLSKTTEEHGPFGMSLLSRAS